MRPSSAFLFAPPLEKAHPQTSAILTPEVTPASGLPAAGVGHGVAAHLGQDAEPSFDVVVGREEPFPEQLLTLRTRADISLNTTT